MSAMVDWIEEHPGDTLPVHLRPRSRIIGWLQGRGKIFIADPNGNVKITPATL